MLKSVIRLFIRLEEASAVREKQERCDFIAHFQCAARRIPQKSMNSIDPSRRIGGFISISTVRQRSHAEN
jgi:hypothetical protein